MFAYCGNNPVCRLDSSGYFFFTVLGAAVGAAFGALDAAIQGKKGAEFNAMVASSATSGAISGAAADVLSFTGATVGVAVGVMAAVGAVGSLAGSWIEYKMTKDLSKDNDPQKVASDAFGDMVSDAVLSGLFAYMGGPVASQMGKIAKRGFWSVAKNFYIKEIKNTLSNLAEEALVTVTGGLAEFTVSAYQRAFSYTAEMWFN